MDYPVKRLASKTSFGILNCSQNCISSVRAFMITENLISGSNKCFECLLFLLPWGNMGKVF